jgi:hypothetical protein
MQAADRAFRRIRCPLTYSADLPRNPLRLTSTLTTCEVTQAPMAAAQTVGTVMPQGTVHYAHSVEAQVIDTGH